MTFCKLFVIPLWFPAFWSFTALAPPSLADAVSASIPKNAFSDLENVLQQHSLKEITIFLIICWWNIGSWKQIEPSGEVLQNEFIHFRSGSKECIWGISAMMGYFLSIISIHLFYSYLSTKTIGLFIVKWIGKERSKTIQ